jgi:hypothetical protein
MEAKALAKKEKLQLPQSHSNSNPTRGGGKQTSVLMPSDASPWAQQECLP